MDTQKVQGQPALRDPFLKEKQNTTKTKKLYIIKLLFYVENFCLTLIINNCY